IKLGTNVFLSLENMFLALFALEVIEPEDHVHKQLLSLCLQE
ncbi:hypothetical protein A2U01_0091432, partial [Trifolium medium]|nr:hypothetical protein [Trifolium medium]